MNVCHFAVIFPNCYFWSKIEDSNCAIKMPHIVKELFATNQGRPQQLKPNRLF